MGVFLKGRSLLSLMDFTKDEIRYVLDLSHKLKNEKGDNKNQQRLLSKTVALLFEKRSTRTRCSFETAVGEEGGSSVFLSTDDIHLGEKESIEDTARVLGRMFSAIMFRGFHQETAEKLRKFSGVPVYNGLTDEFHPTQVLADLLTIEEAFGRLKGIKVAYVGDGRNNMALTLMIGCAKMGTHCTIVAPPSLHPAGNVVDYSQHVAETTGTDVSITSSIDEGVSQADVIYTDVWISMGEEDRKDERIRLLKDYQINAALMKKTGLDHSIFLHCLPAVKGMEVTEEVFESPYSRVFEQAENRKHTIKALLLATLL
ncbi:MAG: ornithine carbamoyltransferase [Spirochaetales bacterium]|nr:ornithine carbamoyltransferase [Spirochaetales bacterium]